MFVPVTLDRFEGLVTRPKPEKVPPGRLLAAKNVRLAGDQIGPRPGLSLYRNSPGSLASINGIGALTDALDKKLVVWLESTGRLFCTNPYPGQDVGSVITVPGFGEGIVSGSGDILELIITAASHVIAPGRYMDTATAYGRIYMCYSNLQEGLVPAENEGPRQLYWDSTIARYRYAGVGIIKTSLAGATPVSSGTAGDIEVGVRYAVLLEELETGYQSGWQLGGIRKITVLDTDPNESLTISGILAPQASHVTRRIIAFTEAGASSAGPYFYIPTASYIEGLNRAADANGNNITSTVIDDNGVTSLTVSFPDEFLLGGVDVTNFLDKMGNTTGLADTAFLGPKSVYFSKTLRRLIWGGRPNNNTFFVSEPDDPETYYQTTSLVKPGDGDGGSVITAREFRGELYFLKNNGGHLAVDTSLTPSEWKVVERWTGVGPCGVFAVDVDEEFMAFAHKTGAYLYRGNDLEWISPEISGNKDGDPSWDKINWDFEHLIYCTIDDENKLVRFGVPYDQSTKVNKEFICDYSDGWAGRRGVTLRKWSVDDCAATRSIMAPTSDMGTQLLFASNADDSLILREDKTSLTLNGAAMEQRARLAYTPHMKEPGIYRLGVIDVTVGGVGTAHLRIFGYGAVAGSEILMPLTGTIADFSKKNQSIQNERFSLEISNGTELGTYFELQRAVLWVNKVWNLR